MGREVDSRSPEILHTGSYYLSSSAVHCPLTTLRSEAALLPGFLPSLAFRTIGTSITSPPAKLPKLLSASPSTKRPLKKLVSSNSTPLGTAPIAPNGGGDCRGVEALLGSGFLGLFNDGLLARWSSSPSELNRNLSSGLKGGAVRRGGEHLLSMSFSPSIPANCRKIKGEMKLNAFGRDNSVGSESWETYQISARSPPLEGSSLLSREGGCEVWKGGRRGEEGTGYGERGGW